MHARAVAVAIALLHAGPATAQPRWRYGASVGVGASQLAGAHYQEVELTLQGSHRVAPGWWLAAHLHDLRLSSTDDTGPHGEGYRIGLGLEHPFAFWGEGGAGISASVRAGLFRDSVHWDRGRLQRDGAYVELRGLVDLDLDGCDDCAPGPRGRRWFGMGLSVRGFLMPSPRLLDDGPQPAAGSSPGVTAGYDAGVMVSWEWVAGR
ncbi:MAG TPA: hypothetical protein VL172_05385 [Kofleriaceae bacterium]|jgi:hypothetical protein|nr:hypothetical protein [Kofleriaceae bacterium]